jgi:hypothetical protein
MAAVLASDVGATLMTLNENFNILLDARSSKYMQIYCCNFFNSINSHRSNNWELLRFSVLQNNKMLTM